MKIVSVLIVVILAIAAVTITIDTRPEEALVIVGEIDDFAHGSVTPMELFVNVDPDTPRVGDSAVSGAATIPVFIVRELDGSFLALYGHDPHLGCRITHASDSDRETWNVENTPVVFITPCHGEMYDSGGNYFDGPTPRGMDRFDISTAGTDVWVNFNDFLFGPEK